LSGIIKNSASLRENSFVNRRVETDQDLIVHGLTKNKSGLNLIGSNSSFSRRNKQSITRSASP